MTCIAMVQHVLPHKNFIYQKQKPDIGDRCGLLLLCIALQAICVVTASWLLFQPWPCRGRDRLW